MGRRTHHGLDQKSGGQYLSPLVKRLQNGLCVLLRPLWMMPSAKHAAPPIFKVV